MIKSKEEYYSILERLRTLNFNQKLGRNLQAKLEAFEEMEGLVNLIIPVVMPMLLCIDSGGWFGITEGKKYKLIFEEKVEYVFRDDEGDIIGVEKELFKVVEAQ